MPFFRPSLPALIPADKATAGRIKEIHETPPTTDPHGLFEICNKLKQICFIISSSSLRCPAVRDHLSSRSR